MIISLCVTSPLEISQNSQENICARVSFFNKVAKKRLAHVFSCEFCEISKNTFFREHLWTTASDNNEVTNPGGEILLKVDNAHLNFGHDSVRTVLPNG